VTKAIALLTKNIDLRSPMMSFALAALTLLTAVVVATTVEYATPSTSPSFQMTYLSEAKVLHCRVELTYYDSQNIQYTHLFGFAPWNSEFNLFTENNCTNRQQQDFQANNPPLWSSLWSKLSELNETAISGSYLSWPTPSLPWTVSIGSTTKVAADDSTGQLSSLGTVVYEAYFTIEELANCAGSQLISLIAENYFYYGGTFRVIWIQPLEPYLPGQSISVASYSTVSYQFPFTIQVDREVDVIDTDPKMPSVVYSFILDLQWLPISTVLTTDGQMVTTYQLHLLLETKTPASKYSDGRIANYNDLSPLSEILMPASIVDFPSQPSFILTLNLTDPLTVSDCVVLSSSASGTGTCMQRWSYYSLPQYNLTVHANDTYYFTATLRNCYYSNTTNLTDAVINHGGSSTSGPTVCSSTTLVTSIKISIDLFLDKSITINVVDQFHSNLTYYDDRQLTTLHAGSNYLPDQNVIVKHSADLYPLSTDYYTLIVQNVYVCSIVDGGQAPYLGYDSSLGVWRKGCSAEEYIDGVINIPSSTVFVVALNNTATSCCGYENLNESLFTQSLPKSQDAILFSLASMSSTTTSVYIHIESRLYYSSGFHSTSASSPLGHQLQAVTTNFGVASQSASGDSGTMGVGAVQPHLYDFGMLDRLSIIRDDSSTQSAKSSKTSAAIIGGSVGGSVLFVGLCVLVIILVIKRKRKNDATGIAEANKKVATAAAIATEDRWEAVIRTI
jgi:hypothetical protein